ncbi:MAG: TIGR03067 domain-containing protein [Pirellulales bacterium]
MRVDKGKDADRAWADIVTYGSPLDPATMHRFDFVGGQFVLDGEDRDYLSIRNIEPRSSNLTDIHLPELHFRYRIDPSAAPKRIDLLRSFSHRDAPATEEVAAVGIYELHGDRLQISLTRYQPSLQEDAQRPKDLTRALGPHSVMFVFTRYRPSEEVRALQGDWAVVSQTDDANPREDRKFRKCRFDDPIVSISDGAPGDSTNPNALNGIFALDAVKTPKQITLSTHYYEGKYRDETFEFLGIYKFEGNQLHIAYRKGGPRPEKFESTPGSGVTLLVLEGGKQAKTSTPVPSPATDPAAEFKALEGPWKVVRADTSETDSELSRGYRLDFDPSRAVLTYPKKASFAEFTYSIDPTTTPRTIDLFWTDKTLRWIGIYQLDGDRLHLCLVERIPALDKQQRPSRFDRAAGDALIVLDRYRPSEDEKALRSQRWQYVSQTVDGPTIAEAKPRETVEKSLYFTSGNVFVGSSFPFAAESDLLGGTYVLDSAKKPRTITLFARFLRAGTLAETEAELAGIYKLEGNRLTIAYRKDGPPPEKFESTPGSGVTLLVLRGENQARIAKPAESGGAQAAAGDKSARPDSPWTGQLPNGAKVELLAVGEGDRWWQPNGSPLAESPFKLEERRSQPAEPGFERRAFVARISGLPLLVSGMNVVVEPSSGTNEWIDYESIQKVPTRSHFSGVQTAVPTAAKNVTLRWGISTGPWEDIARAVVDSEGRPVGPGSWGQRLNSLHVLVARSETQLEMPDQPEYEERAIAIGDDGHETVAIFQESQGMARATLPGLTTKQIKEIKLQRRPYAWVEFRDVPTRWSEVPIRSTDAPPNTCNVAAQPTGPWLAQLPRGVTVDLVGVGEGEQWWRPDGSPLPEPPCRFESGAKSEDNTQVPRRFFLRVNGLPSQPAGIVAELASGTAAEYPESVEQNGQVLANRVNVLAFETRIAATSRTVTQLRCGVAVGPWRESAWPSVNLYPKYISGGISGGGHNTSLHAEENKEGVVATVSEDWLDEDDLRLVAITYEGRAVTGRARIDHPTKQQIQTTITATLPGLTLKEIKELNVERRPYDWVCFTYVAARRKSPEDTPIAESQPNKAAETPDARPAAGDKPKPPAQSPAVNPAAEFKALEGPWKVVRAETSEAASELSQAYRLDFDPSKAVLTRSKKSFSYQFAYAIDPTTTPKTIDLLWPHKKSLWWLGIYQLDGDRLNLCLVKHIPALDKQQRPSRFDRAAGDAMLVLERYRPSEDENALRSQGWQYVSQTVDGKMVAGTKPRGTLKKSLWFLGGNVFAADVLFAAETELSGGTYVLDPAKKPRAITLYARLMRPRGGGSLAEAELAGIYSLEGNRLTIAYRKTGPSPEKFESTPGSGVTLLVLEGELHSPRNASPQAR